MLILFFLTQINFITPKNGDFITDNPTVTVQVTSSVGIKNIVAYLNNELIGNLIPQGNDTYVLNLPLQKLLNQNELKIEATDTLDQTNNQTIIIYH